MTQPDTRTTGQKLPQWISHTYEAFFHLLKRLLGQDVRFLARNATLVTISHGISMVRGLVTGYLVARLFPREMYGQYQFILSVVGAILIFGLPGLGSAVSRAIARGEKGVLPPIARVQFLIALTGSAILLAAIALLPESRKELWPLFVLAALLFPVSQTALTVFAGITVGKERFDLTLRANIVWSVLTVLATLLLLLFHPSAALLFATVTIFPMLAYLYFSRPFLKRTKPEPSIRPIIRYGIQLSLVNLPITLSWYLDKLIISATLGLNQLAIFSVALLIPEQVKVWVKELLPISFAMQAKGEDSWERRIRLIRVVGRSTFFFLIGILLYILIAPFAFLFLFPNYPEATFLTQVFSITLLTMPSALFTQYMEAQGMLGALRKSQWISALSFTLATITLIPMFGLLGAVLARGILRLSISLSTLFFLLHSPTGKAVLSQHR